MKPYFHHAENEFHHTGMENIIFHYSDKVYFIM